MSPAPAPAPASTPPEIPTDLPDFDPLAEEAVARAAAAGEAAAAATTPCGPCEECPHCYPYEVAMRRYNTAFTELVAERDTVVDHLRDIHLSFAQAWGRTRAAAYNRWAAMGMAWNSANNALWSMWSDNPWLSSGAGMDPTRFSTQPRDGWLAYEVSAGVTLYCVDEAALAEAAGIAQMLGQAAAFEALSAEVARLWDATMDAKATAEATGLAYDAAMAALRAYWDQQIAALYDPIREWELLGKQNERLHITCLDRCKKEDEDEEGWQTHLIGWAARAIAGAVAIAGGMLVIGSNPFGIGDPGTTPTTAPSATSAPTPAVTSSPIDDLFRLPDATTDQAMLDTWATQLGMGSAFPGTVWTDLFPGDLTGKFGWTPATPVFFTSFFTQPLVELDLFPGVLGDPVNVVGTSVVDLAFTDPGADPIGDIIGWYGPMATATVGPVVPSAPANVLAASLQLDGNLLDPAFCSGRTIQYTLVGDSGLGSGLYTAGSSFPGDYYQAGNTFFGVEFTDCEPRTYMQMFDGTSFSESPSPGGLLITPLLDGGSSITSFLPAELFGDGSSTRQVLFEVLSGQGFEPENTRFQSVPNVFGPMLSDTDRTSTADCDFGLPEPPPTSGDPSGPAPGPVPTPTTSTGGGGGTPGGGGSDGGGGTTPGGTDTGTDTGGAPTDPTDIPMLLLGLTLAGLGGGALGGTRKKRLLDGTSSPDAPAATPAGGGGTAATGPQTTAPPAPTGPTTTLPGAAQLAASRLREREASEAARQEAITTARERVTEAERAYASAVSRYTARKSQEANESAYEQLHDWWTNKSKVETRLLSQAQTRTVETFDALRKAVAEYVTLELLLSTPSERLNTLARLSSDAPNEHALEVAALTAVESVIGSDEDDRRRAQTLAVHHGRLRSARLWQEAISLASNKLDPSGLPAMLDALATGIRDTREQREHLYGESQAHYDAREWLRDTRRDLRIETAITLAERGTVIDPRDGSRVHSALRIDFAGDRLRWMTEYLEHSSWRRDDPRDTRATMLKERLKDAYASTEYIGNGDVSMAEYFLAVTVTIRNKQTETNTWFIEDYLGLPSEGQGTWWDTIKVGWSVKAGTSGRVAGLGENSLEVVRQRIQTMNVQADEAVRALETAARTPNPDDLPRDVLSMLGRLGYVRTDASGTRHYQLPTAGDRTASAVTRIDRPGASWLDVISVQNASEVLVSVALPQLASVRITAIATRLGLSSRAVTALRLLTDQGLGLALDVGFQAAHSKGKADLTTIAFQSLVMSWTGMLGRKVTDFAAAGSMARLTATKESKELVVRAISEAFGIPGDAVQQLVFQSLQTNTGVSENDVLAALLGSAMNRYVGRLGSGAATRVEDALTLLPRGLREASIVLTPTMREAMRTDARLNQRAESAFDRILGGDATMDRDAGSRIFEALRAGELSWSQLQRVYTSRGEAIATVMDQVRIERDQFAQSVTSRARAQARDDVTTHFDDLIAKAGTEAERTRLSTEKQSELDLIGDPTHEVATAARFTSEGLEIASANRDDLLNRIGGDEDLSTLTDAQLRTLALDKLTSEFEKALKEPRDVIQPGSAGATSDIDRSWASEFLRSAAQRIILAEMTRGRIDGAMGPTTARAFDVNEYVNVMRRISKIIGQRSLFADVDVAITVPRADGTTETVTLKHKDVVEANSFAGAMLHLTPSGRRQFETNKLEGTTGPERTRLERMFTHAKQELASSAETLRRYVEEEATRLGTSTDDPDTQLRARDRLYGDRMAALDTLGRRIDAAPDGSAERAELMSQWERDMNTALRDGIETYSDMANLDIIVSRLQGHENADGSKKTIEQLLQDPVWRAETLAHVDQQQLQSMVNDQILMLGHHIGAFHNGHESAAKATRSLAKYAERALLALGLLGQFHPGTDGPHSELWAATKRLMKYKDQPELLLRELASLNRGTRGDVDASLRWYLDQLQSIPGMKGLTGGPASGAGGPGWNSSATRRDWWRRLAVAGESGRTQTIMGEYRIDAENEIQRLTLELERLRGLAQFRSQDRRRAGEAMTELSNLQVRVGWLSGTRDGFRSTGGQYIGGHLRGLQTQVYTLQQELEAFRLAGRNAGTDAELEARIADVERRLAGHRARLTDLATPR